MRILRELGITVLVAVITFVILQFNIQSYTVDGASMMPDIQQGQHIMVNKVIYRFSEPKRGEVIVFDPPFNSARPFIKRVIGLPGEVVEIRGGRVFINGRLLNEPEHVPPAEYVMPARQVGDNEYFVLGDNRNNSRDSSEGWLVPRQNIIGKAWFTFWPPTKWGIVKHYIYPTLSETSEQALVHGHLTGMQLE